MKLQEIRNKYPQYDDLSDEVLANKLHAKFYSDMPIEEFYSKVGYNPEAKGWAGVGSDIWRGAKKAPGMLWDVATSLPEEAYGAFEQLHSDKLRVLQNAGVGLAQMGHGILNTPANIADYLARKEILPKDLEGKVWRQEEHDFAKMLGREGTKRGDALISGTVEYLPYLLGGEAGALGNAARAGTRSLAAGAHAIGKNENPLTSVLAVVLAEGIRHGVPKAAEKIKGQATKAIKAAKGYSSENLAKKIVQSKEAVENVYSKKYNAFFEAAKESGADQVKIPKFKSKSLIKAAETKEANAIRKFLKDPTIENAHRAQSDLGKLYRSLKGTKKARSLNSDETAALRSALKSKKLIKESIHKSLGKDLTSKYEEIGKGYKKEVVPYNNKVIYDYLDEGYTDPDFIKALNTNKRARKHIVPLHPEISVNQMVPKVLKGLGYGGAGAWGFMKLKDILNNYHSD